MDNTVRGICRNFLERIMGHLMEIMAGIFSEIIDEILWVFIHMHSLYCQLYNRKYVILKK
jgi:hypothetical protein